MPVRARALILIAALLAAGAIHLFRPRRAHLREFDPAAVARLETGMWRDYYDHHYPAMFGRLYRLERDAYGFSPWDSIRIAWYAAVAAKRFQPTTNRAEAEAAAVPPLTRYYALIRARSGESFDPARAARLELEWWQLRREHATADAYGAAVARNAEEVFGTRNDALTASAMLRAAMMHYRDERRDGGMHPADWDTIAVNLTRSYEMLRQAVSPVAAGRG